MTNLKAVIWLLTSVLIFGCGRTSKEATIILTNGNIICMDSAFTIADAVAIKGSNILQVGGLEQIAKLKGKSTQVIDLQGRTVIPGLFDAHAHMISAAMSEQDQSIPTVNNIEDVLQSVADKASKMPADSWIVFPKLFSTRLIEMRWPTLKELDSVAPHHPVLLDGSYAVMVNSKALLMSGIDKNSTHQGIQRHELSGELTGVLRGSAFDLLKMKPPDIATYNQRVEAVVNMMSRYNQAGITSVNIRATKPGDMELLQDILESGRSSVRTNLTFHQSDLGIRNEDPLDSVHSKIAELGFRTGSGNDWIKVGPLKWQIDGGILTGTAFLREPWAKYQADKVKEIYGIDDNEYQGVSLISKERLTEFVTLADSLGWDFTAHCTGGGGVDLMLESYEDALARGVDTNRHLSIIHGNFYTPESIEKMKTLRVFADMQPAWFYKDADAMLAVLGEERIRFFHPYKSLIEAGVIINGGSDHMVKLDSYTSINPYNPFLAMWSVITRQTDRGNVIVPEEAINRKQALAMYTINNVLLTKAQASKGSLEAGKLADLVVISKDILNCPVNEIKDIQVEMTIVDGEVVWSNNEL